MRFFSTLFFFAFTISFYAQNNNKQVLFTVDEDPVYASEFIRVFNKNLDLVKDESQKDVDAYLKLFVSYKLKLKEAKTLGFDTMPKYKRELSNYKSQLAKNYLTDNKVTDALVNEAYERTTNEVNASHILIRIDENASPKDTLVAYNDLLKLRGRVIDEGYKAVQKEVHNGKTIYAEDLGYFSGFKMVYPFENAAYNTSIGEVSLPFRTQFGYHIVKVFDKRKSRGQREVAHIMINLDKEDAESRIQDIYKKLEQGEDFEPLAKQFSEDKSTSTKGGKLSPFSSGELRSQEFEDQAFSIEEEGVYTKPFKSNFGWHIMKLIKKIETPPFQDMKSTLEAKVKRDSRSKLISTSRINKLKERYAISNVDKDLAYFTSILNNEFYKSKWKTPESFQPEKAFVTIEKKQFTYKDFADFLIKSQRRNKKQLPLNKIVENTYNAFLEEKMLAYQEENLEFENEDFANILGEYRDGLLLFDLMENEIWKAAANDSVAVQEFFNANKTNYFFNERVDAVVASSAKKKDINKVAKLLKNGITIEEIKSIVNTEDQVHVIFTSGLMDAKHQALPKGFSFKKGVSKVFTHNDSFVVVKVNEILPKTQKTFEEAKGKVSSDFQDAKEKKWLVDLENKYKVTIHQDVLTTVKSKLNKD
ncbi:peptidylprolyl isomerase [Oceanihabitans sp. 2_MG-2023]|uniref:peptidylprolyl isomerase n=1 Tax=Oceanihabitans sp. 2_MG-2023 TaxID=3062661 RepID=UPI0026E3551B|nr:peptidylprolyl isomerase [Oceanihabitans sp. 2_MG-2023]MDO6597736.1 peptidylprolyl isomerase [Oceanihabitans sp. 2_MG-2023]